MLATQNVIDRIPTLLAADATTLNPAAGDELEMVLLMADFAPAPNLVIGDLTLATFDGSGALSCAAGAPFVATDPLTGEKVITPREAAGGWRWETTGVTNLPQTIYGAALVSDDQATLFGVDHFDTPIVLTAADQEINLGTEQFRMVQLPLG
jgi:hypothetical protein